MLSKLSKGGGGGREVLHLALFAPTTMPPIPEHAIALAEVEVLAGNVILANAELKKWTEYKDAMTARLSELHVAGLAPTKFSSHGYMFTLQPGRPSTAFDAAGKLQMADLRSQLVDQGHGVETVGKPFWGTREVKASAQQQAAA